MSIDRLLQRIKNLPACEVKPPAGQPATESLPLPEDLRRFFDLAGGVVLHKGADFEIEIVGPSDFVRANPVIAGVDGLDDPSALWYIIGKSGEQYITIDLDQSKLGRCYDSFWDRHAVRGSCPIIAASFSDMLARLAVGDGRVWYWTEPGFVPLGDAYDKGK